VKLLGDTDQGVDISSLNHLQLQHSFLYFNVRIGHHLWKVGGLAGATHRLVTAAAYTLRIPENHITQR